MRVRVRSGTHPVFAVRHAAHDQRVTTSSLPAPKLTSPATRPNATGGPGLWNRFSLWQLAVMGLATIPLTVIATVVTGGLVGLLSHETMTEIALGAGENPGMLVFGAMFLASPVQWLTGRSQVRVRKYLGICFFALACNNGAMFAIEEGIGGALGAPFLIAGSLALVVASPLFLTSSRWSQRTLGMRRWRHLHRLTYIVAAALLAHVMMIPDIGPGAIMIIGGFVARIPAVRERLQARGRR